MESLLCDSRRGRKPPLQTIRKDVKRWVIHWRIAMLYKQILQNKRKTMWLVTLFSVLVLALGWAIGYLVNNDSVACIIITVIVLAIYIPMTYMTASSQVLNMSGAKQIRKEDHPELFYIVEELSIAARLPMPKVYIVNDRAPNAFAT